jgi:hypothetical protein
MYREILVQQCLIYAIFFAVKGYLSGALRKETKGSIHKGARQGSVFNNRWSDLYGCSCKDVFLSVAWRYVKGHP